MEVIQEDVNGTLSPILTGACDLKIPQETTDMEIEPEMPYKVVVVLEVDSSVEVLQEVTKAVATLQEPDLRLILYHPHWTRIHYDHIDKYLAVGNLTHRCLAETETSKTIRGRLFRLIRNSALSSLKYASSLLQGRQGKIVFIKTLKTPLSYAAKAWIKRHCGLQFMDIYSLVNKKMLSSNLQRKLASDGCKYVTGKPADLGNIISLAVSEMSGQNTPVNSTPSAGCSELPL